MRHHLISLSTFILAGATLAFAADPATFVLTNGQRSSGTIAHHGEKDGFRVLERNQLVLNQGNGREQGFDVGQVAAIDFVGGQPSESEIAGLPGSGEAIVLRSGTAQDGSLVDILHGTTVIWRNAAGQQQQYAISDVSRIYLNRAAARTAYNLPPSPVSTRGTKPAASEPAAAAGETVVRADTPWTDTGIDVRKGDTVRFSTRGEIKFGTDPAWTTGPDGSGLVKSGTYPIQAMGVGGLIAKVGNSAPFPIGSNRNGVTMPTNGRLMLGVNDNNYQDNSGAFYVTITRGR